jgi:hypothetical protein
MFARKIVPSISFVLALCIVVAAYHDDRGLHAILFDSDALYMPAVFADLFAGGGKLADWYLTPAPYFFPDYLLYLPAWLLGATVYDQVLVFALLQITAVAAATYAIAGAVVKEQRAMLAATVTIALTGLALTSAKPYVELLASAFHYGAFLSSLLFVACWLRLRRDGAPASRSAALAGMVLVTFASALSDNLFLVQAVAPFLLALLVFPYGPGYGLRARRMPALLVLGAGLAGSLSYRLVVARPTRYPARFGLEKLGVNVQDLLAGWWEAVVHAPALGAVFVLYGLCVLASIRACIRKEPESKTPEPLVWITVFSLLSLVVTSITIVLMTSLETVPRYQIPSFTWPVVVSALWLAHLARQRFYVLALALVAVQLGMLGMGLDAPGKKTGPERGAHYPAEIACIDRALAGTPLRHGIAQYWDAKLIQAFSHQPLTLAQHTGDLNEHRWITSDKFFRPGYDFAIISENAPPPYKINRHRLLEMNGAPANVVACGSRTVLLYPQGKLQVKPFAGPKTAVRWKGCQLPTQFSASKEGCEAQKNDPAQAGFASFGPYHPLPAGRYAFRLAYASSRNPTETAGEWDAVLALPEGAKKLAAGPLAGTADGVGEVKGSFRIDAGHDMKNIEIRAFSSAGGTMKIRELEITRLD